MAVNTNYGYGTAPGVAGGIYDISQKTIVSRILDATAGVNFGKGLVQGTSKGVSVKTPSGTDTADTFEGILTHAFTQSMDEKGKVIFRENQTVDIMTKGKAWVRVSPNATVGLAYGADVYLVVSDSANADNVGTFTDASDATSTTKIKLNAKYITDNKDGIAVIELA